MRIHRQSKHILVGVSAPLGGSRWASDGKVMSVWCVRLTFLDFSFDVHEIALDSVSGADFGVVLHHFSSLAPFEGSWGQVWLESGPKPAKTKMYILVS